MRTVRQRGGNKVPDVTVFFWIIKILAVTVGGTFADLLSDTLRLGLTLTTAAMSFALAVVLCFQFRIQRYVPALYWLVVVLAGIVGALFSDNLVDNVGVPLEATAIVFAVALAGTFATWYATERTLSIRAVDTPRREAYYWLAILFTFALGTAAGDLAADRLGYGLVAGVFAALIALVTVAHLLFGLGAVLAFWIAYVLTRPFGAAVGDLLAQPHDQGGAALGTVVTSLVFLAVIAGIVIYLTRTRRDAPRPDANRHPVEDAR
jgi:uncharacterized membrane-anchored protein